MSNLKRPPRPKLESASDVLQKLFKQKANPLSDEYKRWNLIHNWQDIVGRAFAERTFPIKYIKGTLYIWCSSASSVQHYYFVSDSMAKKVNDYLGSQWVKKVVWTQNKGILEKIGDKERQYISRLLER